VDRLLAVARRRGLDGFALTEHIHVPDYWSTMERILGRFPYGDGTFTAPGGMVILSGAEVTCAERVDVVLLGNLVHLRRVDEAFTPRLSQGTYPPFDVLLDATAGLPLLRIGVHMFRNGKHLLPLGDSRVRRLDALSVDDVDDERTVAEAKRLGLPLSGGSDAHFVGQLGIKRILVDAPDLTFPALAEAIRQGRTRPESSPLADAFIVTARSIKRWQRKIRHLLR
jgi:hypothetical protein